MAMSVRQCQAVLCLALIQAVLRVSQLDFKWFLVGRVVRPCHLGVGWGGCSLQSVVLSSCLHLPRPASCARNICPLLDCEDLQDHNYTTFNLPTCVGTKFPIFIDNSLN